MIEEAEVRDIIEKMMGFYKNQPLRFGQDPKDFPLYTEPHVVNAMATMLLLDELRKIREKL